MKNIKVKIVYFSCGLKPLDPLYADIYGCIVQDCALILIYKEKLHLINFHKL